MVRIKRTIAKILNKLGLTTILVLLIVSILLGSVGAIGYLSFRNGLEGANNLAMQLQDSLQARIKQNLDEFLAKPHAINRINAEALRSGLVHSGDFPGQRTRFLQQVQAFDSVLTCAFGSAEGDFIGAGWRGNGLFDCAIADKSTGNDYHVFILDEHGDPGELVNIVRDYDPRTRSWYQSAIQARQPAWSPIYTWASQSNIGISAVLPVHDKSGALLGVQLSALSLEHVSRFLEGLSIGITGQAFIVERSGLLVASSLEPPTRRMAGQSGTEERFPVTESTSSLARSAAAYLIERYGSLDRITGDEKLRVSLSGQEYFLNVTLFSDRHGLDWLIAVIIPESDFLGHVNANTRATLLMSIAALIVAVLIVVYVARWITQPILKLNAFAQDMSHGKWQEFPITTRFREVRQLGESFNRMGGQLREAFGTLEDRVRERTHELAAVNQQLQTEIIERTKTEEALRESRGKLEAALASMTDAVFISDTGGRFINFNDAFATFHRFKNKEECAKSFAEHLDILDLFLADGELSLPEGRPVARALRGETAANAEYTVRRKDTGVTWVGSYSFGPIRDKDGEIVGAVVVGRDITHLKRAEKALHEFNETLSRAVQGRTAELVAANRELEERARQLRLLAGELTMTEQRERKQLSKILHDGLQQYLVAAKMQVAVLTGESNDAAREKTVSTLESLLGESIRVSRSLAAELSPPILHDGGILAGVEWLTRWMSQS